MKHRITHDTSAGFSVVELLVTLLVAAVFVGAFYQVYTVINQSNTETRWRAAASDLAYNNMRQYPDSSSVISAIEANGESFTCDDSSWYLIDETSSDPVEGVPAPVNQYVIATVPYQPDNCSVIKLESVVLFGQWEVQREVNHATYVSN